RLDAIFPVEFQFLDVATKKPIGEMKQGFTRDIGRGGICLEANNIGDAFKQALKEQKARLDLRMHIPLKASEKKAVAEISWCKEIKSDYPNKYLIGLSFLEISAKDRDSIYSHAKKISLLPKIVSIAVILLFFGVLYFYSVDFALKKENKRLVTQLVELSGKRSILEKDILVFDSERNELESELLENQDKLVEYKQRVKELKKSSLALKQKYELLEHFEQDKSEIESELKAAVSEKEDLTEKVANLSKEAQDLKNRISNLTSKRATAEGDLKTLLTSFEDVEDKNIKNMYKWIENHQNRLTGLVTSYEGDKKLEDWAFTYDQSLVAQVFTLMGDQEKARAIFDFYKHKAKKAKGSFVNAYDSYTGLVLEYSVHAGPNIWLGIAALQYTQKFKDKDYLPLAEDIAGWLIKLQNDDKEFGIKGGPDFTWFSTEHNLDAYAFFGMLYKITEEEKYLQAQERTLEWIKKNAFNKKQGRFNRGKGDATIATDTFAWAIAALGPELL
ncbi:MAG: hypothetical protein QGI05_04125, partial [Candidatus Omnitrophota bacterium]|nr:hypothetical protein [Candidatus Omnitrophota bacterium]